MKVIRAPSGSPKYLYIHRDLLDKTVTVLRNNGRLGEEGLVFWYGFFSRLGDTGIAEEGEFDTKIAFIQELYEPNGDSSAGHFKVSLESYADFGSELSSLRRQKIPYFDICLLHSHPGKAYHSGTDNKNIFNFRMGLLSLVLPNYGRGIDHNNFFDKAMVYEACKLEDVKAPYHVKGKFAIKEWTREEIKSRFIVVSPTEDQSPPELPSKEDTKTITTSIEHTNENQFSVFGILGKLMDAAVSGTIDFYKNQVKTIRDIISGLFKK